MFTRHPDNPLITPRQIAPSRPDFEVIGTFNAGVTTYGDETLMLVRVAERPLDSDPQMIAYPHMAADGLINVEYISRADERFDTRDPRMIRQLHGARGDHAILTSISHFRLARSHDGAHFTVDHAPWLAGEPPYETYGIEDARITLIDGVYYVNYSAVSPYGIATGLVTTRDFVQIERHGLIFPPANRDVVLFPEKISGQYVCYHRPMPGVFGSLNMWIAFSPDLRHWGDHRMVLEAQPDGWEGGRVGGGCPPLRTDAGWLTIYHAADRHDRYCLGAFLTPLDQPERIIARAQMPILQPEAPYETVGFFPNVVFTCGAILHGNVVKVYYGAADAVIALAEIPLATLLAQLSS